MNAPFQIAILQPQEYNLIQDLRKKQEQPQLVATTVADLSPPARVQLIRKLRTLIKQNENIHLQEKMRLTRILLEAYEHAWNDLQLGPSPLA
ncbi:MAG: hypothetical protein AAF412_06795 [Pseudomonadota bacterium]